MVDYFKVRGAVSVLNLTSHCELVKPIGNYEFLYKIYNKGFTEYLSLIVREGSRIITISGNLRKWKVGKINAVRDLNKGDFVECINLLASFIGANENELWNFDVRRVELGANLNIGKKYDNVLDMLIHYPRLTRTPFGKTTLKFVGSKYEVKFYFKIDDVFKSRKSKKRVLKKLKEKVLILRAELIVKGKSALPIKEKLSTLGDVRDNFDLLIEEWLKTLEKVKVADTLSDARELENGKMTFTEEKEYHCYRFMKIIGLTEFLELAKKLSKYNKPEEKKKWIKIYETYQSGNKAHYFDHVKQVAKEKAESMKIDKPTVWR